MLRHAARPVSMRERMSESPRSVCGENLIVNAVSVPYLFVGEEIFSVFVTGRALVADRVIVRTLQSIRYLNTFPLGRPAFYRKTPRAFYLRPALQGR